MPGEADERQAFRRLELVPSVSDELRVALTEGDQALYTDGDLLASRRRFERAYQLAEREGDVLAMATAALGLAGTQINERRALTDLVPLQARLQHVLALLDQGSVLALRIRARLAGEADYRRGEHGEIMAVLEEARSRGDPVALAEALAFAYGCLLGVDHISLRGGLALELLNTSVWTGRRGDQLLGLAMQAEVAYIAGDPHAGRLLGELRDQLAQHHHHGLAFSVSAIEVMLAIRAGDLEEAESLVGVCAMNGAAAGDIDSESWAGGQLLTIRWYQGRLTELLPILKDSVDSRTLSPVDNSLRATLSVAAALDGDRLTAESRLASLCGSDLADLPRESSSWLVTLNGVVEAAYLLHQADVAARAYELLSPYAHLPMVAGPGVTCLGSTHQALGVAALTMGEIDQAVDHLQAAVRANVALGHWPAVVSSRHRLAKAYTLRGQAGDEEAAERERAAAKAEAQALNLPVPVDRVTVAQGSESATCTRVGRKWRVALRDRSVLAEDSVGMLHLAVLLANPRQEIAASDLVAGVGALTASRDIGSPQAVLDPRAVAEYRSRLRSIDDELGRLSLDEGRAQGEPPQSEPLQAERLRAEREWLVAQLGSATGLSMRQRSFPDEVERARVSVGKAIRRAIARIAESDDLIAEHLRQTVRTGTRCSYWP